jgi:hypothetical protein
MKLLLFTFLFLTSFYSFSIDIFSNTGSAIFKRAFPMSANGYCGATQEICISKFKTVSGFDLDAEITNFSFKSVYIVHPSIFNINYTYTYDGENRTSFAKIYHTLPTVCSDFESCKLEATELCEIDNTPLIAFNYISVGEYTKECGEPAPDEPIDDAEECTDLANNECFAHGGFSGNLTFDDGATSGNLSCDFTCNDGTTGDKFGSNANDPDGFCDVNNPNDLADCDVADNVDPDCVIGCGDAFTPDPTTDLDYTPDGTTSSDGTGTDGITTTQGDVLINEIKKLKNNNSEQIIKGSNKVADAVESIDPNDKLSELITAVKDNKPLPSDGSGNNFNDTNIVSSINSLQQSVNQGAADTVAAIEGNSLNNVIGNSLAYDTSNFDSVLSDTAQLDVNIAERQQTLKDNISLYKSTLTSQLSFLTPMSNGYSTNNLVLSQGSYDVSWSRFSQYFSTIGTIVYSLAALIALSILFVGRF